MRTRVTVGFDGSTSSTNAVFWALAEAEKRQAAVQVVACYSMPAAANPWMGPIPYDLEAIHQSAIEDLETVADRARAEYPRLQIDTAAIMGPAAIELVSAANGAEMLVVGTKGAGAIESWVLGSVAHAVARTSPCPVVMVPAGETARSTGRIVVGVDGSPAADAALDWATAEADLRDAALVVVHAWCYPYTTEIASAPGRDFTRVDGALVLEKAMARSRARTGRRVDGQLVEDDAAPALLAEAAHADLVVVGSRGRGGFRSVLFGSVAHAVARSSPCPTVVVRRATSDLRAPS